MRAPQAEKRLETVSMTTMFYGASSTKEPKDWSGSPP